jgi:hypothetical protein
MLLFSPSPGQIVDRLSILELKIKASTARGFDTQALEVEAQACREALTKRTLPENQFMEYESLVKRLRVQNQGQWESETALRSLTENLSVPPAYEELIEYVKTVSARDKGNELRAFLVASIDGLFNEVVERKMYR